MNEPPTSEADLLDKAHYIAGMTLETLGKLCQQNVPSNALHAKGWVGQMVEKILGANASNLDQADFTHLGIELKTIPISTQGKIRESTYICAVSIPPIDSAWEHSRVWRKIAKILWVPIESNPNQPFAKRRIGQPILWSPSPSIAHDLRLDWEELTELITLGCYEKLNAHTGKYLQIRPKAANAKVLIEVINEQGELIQTIPKGFYFRSCFTQQIINEHYLCR